MIADAERVSDYIKKVLDFRAEVFAKIISKNSEQLWRKASLEDVRRVVVIAAASRSGSSLLFALLRKIPQFYSLSGEGVPFYKLNGLTSDVFVSEEIPREVIDKGEYASGISRDFLSDFSSEDPGSDILNDDQLLDRYIDDLALRFPLQWPQVSFSYDNFKGLATQAFDIYKKTSRKFYADKFYLELLWLLRREYKAVNPYYYDIPGELIKEKFPALRVPLGPPNDDLTLEEPPFILLSPRSKIDEADLSGKTLLLKSSADCYRMRFIEKLLPKADIKIIYLVRNPAASINGLYDGWLHRGFFSYNLKNFFKTKKGSEPKTLRILGYSDKYEWGKRWWKYDLPSGWQDYAQSRLEEVCAFQWLSANKAIQEYLDKSRQESCLVRYENIIAGPESRSAEIEKIFSFIGINRDAIGQLGLDKLPVVQATHLPIPERWRKREGVILPLIENPKIAKMCNRLGYDKGRAKEWL